MSIVQKEMNNKSRYVIKSRALQIACRNEIEEIEQQIIESTTIDDNCGKYTHIFFNGIEIIWNLQSFKS